MHVMPGLGTRQSRFVFHQNAKSFFSNLRMGHEISPSRGLSTASSVLYTRICPWSRLNNRVWSSGHEHFILSVQATGSKKHHGKKKPKTSYQSPLKKVKSARVRITDHTQEQSLFPCRVRGIQVFKEGRGVIETLDRWKR